MPTRAVTIDPNAVAGLAVESDELHGPEIDAFIARNREVLSASLRRSYEEAERGDFGERAIEDIIADGRRRHPERTRE